MKKITLILALALSCPALCLIESGCQSKVTLAPGGVYSDPILATTDQAILDASAALDGFVAWQQANSTILAKYPEVGALAAQVSANESTWIKNAYAARDAYAQASKAYQTALAAGTAGASDATANAKLAEMNGALAVITNITAQIATYRAAHP